MNKTGERRKIETGHICEGEINGPFVLSTDGKMKSEAVIEGEKEI